MIRRPPRSTLFPTRRSSDLSQIGHREDTIPRTDHGFVVVEWPIGQADAWIEVAKVGLPEASWYACLPIGHNGGAWQRGRNDIPGICRRGESRRRCVTGIKGLQKGGHRAA